MRLPNWLRKALPNIAGPATPSFGLYDSQGKAPDFDYDVAVENYRSWPYVAMSKNAAAIASTPLRLFATRQESEQLPKIARFLKLSKTEQSIVKLEARIQKAMSVTMSEEIVEIVEHPFLELMRDVNPFREGFEFMEETSLWLDDTGNAYWYVVTGTGLMKNIPVQLWLLPSNLVTIVPDKKKFIKAYKYGIKGKKVDIDPESIIHFRRPSLKDKFYGYGPVEGAFRAITGFNDIEHYESGTARNPIPQLIIKYLTGFIDRKHRRELTTDWNRMLNNAALDRSNVAGIADGAFDVTPISMKPKEIISPKGREIRREEIVNAFGQSLALYTENPNRANAESAIFVWAKFELDPSMTRIAQKINQTLLPMYDGSERLFCMFDKVAQEEKEFLLKMDVDDRQNNIRTVNEIRIGRGMEPSEEEKADELFGEAPAVLVEPPNVPTKTLKAKRTHSSVPTGSAGQTVINGETIHEDLKGVGVLVGDYP